MMAARGAACVGMILVLTCCARGEARKSDSKPSSMPCTGLAPSKQVSGLCLVHYPISTSSAQCQELFDQGLGYFYSYVWMEAARSFETALQQDPDCPMAWWGLSRALERWGKGDAARALLKADSLKDHASHREQQLILATMQEKGHVPSTGKGDAAKRAAIATLDAMLALYDDDEEAWYYRAQIAGGSGLFGGAVSAVPFYKALLRINPLHPGANHELVHFYEGMQRPALGWPYAEKYIQSSPGLPHAFHMQAHLATRLGRWDRTTEWSIHAVELERAYHREMNVRPADDYQFAHHLEVLLLSLTHDGRFAEARAIEQEARQAGYKAWLPSFRLHLAAREWKRSEELVAEYEKSKKAEKTSPSYLSALLWLRQGQPARTLPHLQVLQQSVRDHKKNGRLELDLWEIEGLYLCQTGSPDAGLKLLARLVERTRDDYQHHQWGNGAYYMEAWGRAALELGRLDVAEEAFLEALAHDRGSIRGALGMQIVCERQGRREEAARFAALAQRIWKRADPGLLDVERNALNGAKASAAAQRISVDGRP